MGEGCYGGFEREVGGLGGDHYALGYVAALVGREVGAGLDNVGFDDVVPDADSGLSTSGRAIPVHVSAG